MKKISVLFFLLLPMLVLGQRLKTEGKLIVDSDNNEVLLRGVGLGGWMLMEGYMMQSNEVADTQHEFRARLEDLIGVEKTDEFFDSWLANHVTKKDIDSLAAWGFNSIRLPMHYNLFTLPIEEEPVPGENTWLSKGFEMTDELLSWCEANSIYLILDLHAAPGGQGFDAAISDYDSTKLSLWESKENRDKTVALWTKLAERYKDKDWLGGYDLINETNWYEADMGSNNALLKQLFVEITTSIRALGDDHIIFIEGNSWANDYTGLTPPWDDNMAYSFHKYWSHSDPGSIQWVIDIRDDHNVPLWMGEAGENSNPWFTDAITLFEANKIGWSWWPMKRIETIVSPYSIEFTQGYKNILEYWKAYDKWLVEGGQEPARPSEDDAYLWMMELAEMTNSSNCRYRKDVHDAMIRQPHSNETLAFDEVTLPGTIYMSDFDLGKHGFAYWDKNYANYSLSTGTFTPWNQGWFYRNDAVDIEIRDDIPGGNGYNLGYVEKGEWINYTVDIEKAGIYDLNVQHASESNGATVHLGVDGVDITSTIKFSATGGWGNFQNKLIEDVILPAGQHTITLFIDADNAANFSKIDFSLKSETIDLPFSVLTANTLKSELSLKVTANYPIDPSTVNDVNSDFELRLGNETMLPVEVNYNSEAPNSIELVFDFNLHYKDNLLLSYTGSGIKDTNGNILQQFTDLQAINMLEPRWILPGRIQAENYINMYGFQLEKCDDTGGGLNLGYADPGDYADYEIRVKEDSEFEIDFRVASQSSQGRVKLLLMNGDGETELGTYTFPSTGGWQNWQTSSDHRISIPAGDHTLRLRVVSGNFNLNWFQSRDFILAIDGELASEPIVYPNPTTKLIKLTDTRFDSYFVRNLQGQIVEEGKIRNNQISLDDNLQEGNYILVLVDQTGSAIINEKIVLMR